MTANIIIWDGKSQIPVDAARALILAADGMFQLKRINLGGLNIIEAVTRFGPAWDTDGLVPFGGASLKLGFAEKIPQALIQKTVAFFSAVYERYHSEAIVLLWYAPAAPQGQRWTLLVPEQWVDGGRCKSDDPGPCPYPGNYLAGDIHSHGVIDGFHSPTDDHDEDHRDGIHITVGGIGSFINFAVSIVIDGERFKLELADLVEGASRVDFDPRWMERVHKIEPAPAQVSLDCLPKVAARQKGAFVQGGE